ncbi:MAG: hypothetical protein JWM43_3777 [Acidobacteriaceae bacterium]|nr:hypothetical protein [Acidobacteriaceae bacterium]
MRDETVALHDALSRSPFHSKLALLPPESLHMTVFSGANDKGRIVWPSDLAPDASIEECNRVIGERMSAFHLHCELPLRVRVDQQRTIDNGRACTLRMAPADEEEERKLRTVRDRLADVYRFRAKDHDRYEFHITLAYQMQRFSASEQSAYRLLLTTHLPRVVAASPILELGMPEYCTFRDMFQFNIQRLLST